MKDRANANGIRGDERAVIAYILQFCDSNSLQFLTPDIACLMLLIPNKLRFCKFF